MIIIIKTNKQKKKPTVCSFPSRAAHTGSHAAVHPEAILTGPSHYPHNERVEPSQPHFSVPQAHPLPPPALALNTSRSHPAHDVRSREPETTHDSSEH